MSKHLESFKGAVRKARAELKEAEANLKSARSGTRALNWVWEWQGGGWNSVRAFTQAEARKKAKESFANSNLNVDWNTFRPLLTMSQVESWDNATRFVD